MCNGGSIKLPIVWQRKYVVLVYNDQSEMWHRVVGSNSLQTAIHLLLHLDRSNPEKYKLITEVRALSGFYLNN